MVKGQVAAKDHMILSQANFKSSLEVPKVGKNTDFKKVFSVNLACKCENLDLEKVDRE